MGAQVEEFQAGHPLKLLPVERRDREIPCERCRCNLHVVRANGLSSVGEAGPKFRVFPGFRQSKRNDGVIPEDVFNKPRSRRLVVVQF